MTTEKLNENITAEQLEQNEELTEEQLDLVAAAGPTNCFQKLFKKIFGK